jgi:arylsulfatase A-like enzyme
MLLLNDIRGRDMVINWVLPGIIASAVLAGCTAEWLQTKNKSSPASRQNTILLSMFALIVAASLFEREAENQTMRPNVILISLDTLRADHLGTYGYQRDTSPHIDALADEGLLFERAYAPSHWTLPSHASMLTGLDPVTLGVLDSNDFLASPYKTLAESLREEGYQTCAQVGGSPWSYIGSRRGFEQGFDQYLHVPYPQGHFQSILTRGFNRAWWKYVAHNTGAATAQVDTALRWIQRHKNAPFFLFLHLFDIHSDSHELPYEAPGHFQEQFLPNGLEGFTGLDGQGVGGSERLKAHVRGERDLSEIEGQLETIIALYDGGIAYTDHEIGRFLKGLETLGLNDNTIIVITADHGESFFEHGAPLHGDLREPNLHVPLIIRAPGLIPARVTDLVQVQDVAPSLLELIGSNQSEHTFLALKLEPDPDYVSSPAFSSSKSQLSLTGETLKMIQAWNPKTASLDAGQVEFFDREIDRAEKVPLAATGNDEQTAFRQNLSMLLTKKLLLRNIICPNSTRARVNLTDEELESLRAIGYGD